MYKITEQQVRQLKVNLPKIIGNPAGPHIVKELLYELAEIESHPIEATRLENGESAPIGHYKVPSEDSKPDPRKINEEEFDTVTSDMYELMVRLSREAGSHRPVLEELVEYLKVNTSLQEQNNFVKELIKAIICYRGKEIEKARIDFRGLEEEVKVLEESIAKLKEQ